MATKNSEQETTEAVEAPAIRPVLLPVIDPITKGTPLAWPIFADTHGSKALAAPFEGSDDRGRPGTVVRMLVQRTNLKGESFTRIQKVLEQFVYQRPEGLVCDMIDGMPLDDALLAHAEREGEFRATQTSSAVVATEA